MGDDHAEMHLLAPVSGRSVVVHADRVDLDESDGRAWLVDGETGERTEISPSGARLWVELDGTRMLAELAEDLGLPLPDTIEFVRKLRANGVAGDAAPDGA